MWNGDAVAHAGRTKLLALLQRLQDGPLALAAELGSLRGQLLQDLLLAVDLQCRNNGIWRDKIGEKHGPFRRWGDQPGPASQRRRTISTPRWAVNGRPSRSAALELETSMSPRRLAILAPALVTAQPRFNAHGRLIGAGIRTRCESRIPPSRRSRARKTRRRSIWSSLPRHAY